MSNTFKADIMNAERKSGRLLRFLLLVAPFVLSAFFLLKFRSEMTFSEQLPLLVTSSFVNFVLAGTYFYSYKSFVDDLYLFIAGFWLSNAIYVMLDFGAPSYYASGVFEYRFGLHLLPVASSTLILVALWITDLKSLQRIRRSIAFAIVLGVGYVAMSLVLTSKLTVSNETRAAISMMPGAAISFLAFCVVGGVQNERLRSKDVDWSRRIILYASYSYALLSLLSPFYPRVLRLGSLFPLFLISQSAKLGNIIALQSITALEYAKVRFEMDVRLSDLKVAEAELQRKSQLAELGALAASIKHDINTPLAAMGFDIDELKRWCQHDHKITRKLKHLQEGMDRIYAIVKVVDIVRGDRGFFDRDQFMNKVSMLEIVHRGVRAVKNERPGLIQQDSKTFIKVEGRDLFVSAYVPMFEQVIVNIIKNALEAIEEAKRERGVIRIAVSLEEIHSSTYSQRTRVEIRDNESYDYSRWVKVEIGDNGTGIDKENFGKLTTLFTTKGDRKPNSGIGLFISKKILDIHEGRIAFQSEIGEETIVSILLPEWGELRRSEEQYYANSVALDPMLAQTPNPETQT